MRKLRQEQVRARRTKNKGRRAVKPVRASAREKSATPTSGRARATFESLVKAAGEVLAEVGFEKLTSNEICARAHFTPPAFYHYFDDKYDILEELAERLIKKQNDAFAVWLLENVAATGHVASQEALENWLRHAADIVSREPGGIWTLRALRALPGLQHVRLRWQRRFTDQIFELARRVWTNIPPDLLWCRIRIVVEFGYVIDELACEEDRIAGDVLFREAARLLRGAIEQSVAPPV